MSSMGAFFAPFGKNDDGVQLDAVAHGNHHVTLDVVEAGGDGGERGRSFAGQIILRLNSALNMAAPPRVTRA